MMQIAHEKTNVKRIKCFDTSSKKEMKMIKTQFFDEKQSTIQL